MAAPLTPAQARAILDTFGPDRNTDFHGLPREHRATIELAVIERRYRAPKHANGSNERYFHAYVTRMAARDRVRLTRRDP